jgi:hypothetical protein
VRFPRPFFGFLSVVVAALAISILIQSLFRRSWAGSQH